MGRKASSVVLFGLLLAASLVAALGTGLAQADKGSPLSRVVTVGVIDEGACPAGITAPCWDTLTIAARPGENLTLVADLRTSEGSHNIQIRDGTGNDAKPLEGVAYVTAATNGLSTLATAGQIHFANLTLPADFKGPLGFVCTVHATSMKGRIVLPAEAAAGGAGGEPVHHLGVHFLAYWVGLIAFALLFVIYGVTFFLFKYNETTATTDQWDRTGAGAPETARRMSGGNATLLAVVIAAVVLGAIVYLARMG